MLNAAFGLARIWPVLESHTLCVKHIFMVLGTV